MFSRRTLIAAAAAPLLAGCSVGGATPRQFSLRPAPGDGQSGGAGWSLAISPPRALKFLDSERIAYQPDLRERQYYAGADWVDRAPQMLQLLMIRSFQTGTRAQVSPQDMPGPQPDFLLTALLQDFQAESRQGGVAVHITLVASLAPTARRQAGRSQSFEVVTPAAGERIDQVVAAFDAAFAELMGRLIPWTLATAEEQRRLP